MKAEPASKPAAPVDASTPAPPSTALPLASFSYFPAQPPPVNVRLVTTPEHDCPYRPGQPAQSRAVWAERMPADLYHRFMDAGFRRSGRVLYQPTCRGCRACQPIRVPVATFQPTKSQRRSLRRNADLTVERAEPIATDEKFDLYLRYVTGWHGKEQGEEDRAGFEAFLYSSPVDTIEYAYRDSSGRLVAVGLCDVCPASLSSVYFYHEPGEAARGVGTFGALHEIEDARRLGIPYYYLGFWIEGCATMHYKNNFRPNEVLHPDGVWRPLVTA